MCIDEMKMRNFRKPRRLYAAAIQFLFVYFSPRICYTVFICVERMFFVTDNQIKMLNRLSRGVRWEWFCDPETDDLLRYLMQEGLCAAREDIAPGMLMLTQKGQAALDGLRKQENEAAKREFDKQCAEAKRIEERRQDHADAERRYRTQNKIAIIMPLVTFALGVLVEHFYGIFGFISSLLH